MSAAQSESSAYVDTERRLVAWGKWASKLSDRLGYPRYSSIARMIEMAKVFEPAEAKKRVTARGKQMVSFRPPTVDDATDDVMEVDRVVGSLPGALQAVILRSYRYGQPDRIAAKELRINRETYTLSRRAAVSLCAERLALRNR